MTTFREQDLQALESAALDSEAQERIAEQTFDTTYAAAEKSGSTARVTATPEFREWMAARAITDAAWGRWAEFIHRTT
jgi:hypothetical protein